MRTKQKLSKTHSTIQQINRAIPLTVITGILCVTSATQKSLATPNIEPIQFSESDYGTTEIEVLEAGLYSLEAPQNSVFRVNGEWVANPTVLNLETGVYSVELIPTGSKFTTRVGSSLAPLLTHKSDVEIALGLNPRNLGFGDLFFELGKSSPSISAGPPGPKLSYGDLEFGSPSVPPPPKK